MRLLARSLSPEWSTATIKRPGLSSLVATQGKPILASRVSDSLTPVPLVVLPRCRTVRELFPRPKLRLPPNLLMRQLTSVELKLLLFKKALLPAVSILNRRLLLMLVTLTTDMLKALLFKLQIVMASLFRPPLTLQVSVVVAGLPTTCPILRLVTPFVLPAVRCRELPKQVGIATIVLDMSLLRQLLVAPPTPPKTLVEIRGGVSPPLPTLI